MSVHLPINLAAPHNLNWSPEPGCWLNRYAHLSQNLAQSIDVPLGVSMAGDPLPQVAWVATNADLTKDLGWPSGWDQASANTTLPSALDVFSGNAIWPGMAPMATVYSGHQFGVWAGQLGDGRALLLGEIDSPMGPQEIQLKGAGRTPYSRGADGRAVLRSSIREYLCSEAMHGLGIPTTRALCLSASPLLVRRETAETTAVVTRVAPSFIRFGHFEHFANSRQPQHHAALQALVDFVITHHYPDLMGASNRTLALLDVVVARTAQLMAAWQAVGFCHGVMNTDNMSILGLTLDYGPFGFLDAFDPDHICNHSDDHGRYAWGNQPQIGYWNLRALAQALLPLIPEAQEDTAVVVGVLQRYQTHFEVAMASRWLAKLGLRSAPDCSVQEDQALVMGLLQAMATDHVDFTIAFRRLSAWQSTAAPDAATNSPVRDLFIDRTAFDAWALRYNARLQAESSMDAERAERMRGVNPVYVLRNHLADLAIRQAQRGDYSEVQRLYRLLQRPFDDQVGCEADADFPPDWARSIEVSCSS